MHESESHERRILDGSSFFISDEFGDAYAEKTHGMFFEDTRFLSAAIMKINGEFPLLLSTKNVDYFSSRFFLTLPFNDVYDQHHISIVRSRLIGHGLVEQVLIQNNATEKTTLMLTLEYAADFADLFEIKGAKNQMHRKIERTSDDGTRVLRFAYQNGDVHRRTIIEFSRDARIVDGTAYFVVELEARESWQVDIRISLERGNRVHQPKYTMQSFGKARPDMQQSMHNWLERLPKLQTDLDLLGHAYHRARIDLASLRFYPNGHERPVLAAGLPWFMALFGRDNLFTSYQTCFMEPELAKDALLTLAQHQSARTNDFTDETPGKILHELRADELTELGKLPYRPYYGSADSTPLFLIVLHEYYRWTGDVELVRSLEQNARRALEWIDKYGDLDGDGYIEYQTKSSQGLVNQCWKDSWNSIQYSDGKVAQAPLATVEIQGYVFDAKIRSAQLAELVWGDLKWAEQLRGEAQALKKRFNADFWSDNRDGYFVVALDAKKRHVDSCTSNMGHLLWSGIVDPEKAELVRKRLFERDMFSGWGIRTLSTSDRGYNPIGYHIGTVWPFDNSIIALGLARYGFTNDALRIISAMVEATQYFEHRLPEAFAGFQRAQFDFPVQYPTACNPQAWSVGAPVLMLRTMLGLEPDPHKKTVSINARLPKDVSYLTLNNLQLFGECFDVHVDANNQQVIKHARKKSA